MVIRRFALASATVVVLAISLSIPVDGRDATTPLGPPSRTQLSAAQSSDSSRSDPFRRFLGRFSGNSGDKSSASKKLQNDMESIRKAANMIQTQVEASSVPDPPAVPPPPPVPTGTRQATPSPDANANTNADANANAVAPTGFSLSRLLSKAIDVSESELPHFASMSFMMFLFIYVFTTARDTKDTLVVSNCGAEAIPFLKLYGVMPCAMIFIVAYSKLSETLSKQALFQITLLPFFIFYALFAWVLYPNRDAIHFIPAVTAATGEAVSAGTAALNVLRYWSFSLYFIVSELWASAGVPLLFWQVANDVTSMEQAKRFYPLFAITGNLAPIVSGKVMSWIVDSQESTHDSLFEVSLKKLASIKIAICIGILFLHQKVYAMADERAKRETIERNIRKIRRIQEEKKIEIEIKFSSNNKPKPKPTLMESMKELFKSRELRAMATMVLCYNVCIELSEVLWKGLLRKQFITQSDYMSYMATFSQYVGVVALLLQLFASTIIRELGWKGSAMITPISMLLLAIPFFLSVYLGPERGVSLGTALSIGTLQNIASKVTKYSLFDPCKEMAYIPLGPEAKVKGKAAVDVLGARLGRSIGSASQQLMVFLIGQGSILPCAPALGTLYVVAILFWTNAVSVLNELFVEKEDKLGEVIRSVIAATEAVQKKQAEIAEKKKAKE